MKKEIFESNIGESYVKAVLDCGLEVYVMEKDKYSSSFAIFGTKYGSVDTRFSKDGGEEINVPEGIAHFLEHKLFESEDGDAFEKYAKTGASANAFTSFDRTCYLFSCSDNFYENLGILLNFVQSPYFTDETVKKEQGIIGQEIRMYEDSPGWRVMFNMLEKMYQNHSVKIEIAGTEKSISEITPKLLFDCYNTFYNPANMFICVVGNVSADKVLKQIESEILFSESSIISRGDFDEPCGVSDNYVSQNLSVSMPMFCFGYKQNIGNRTVDLKSKVCMSLLLELICGDASPLYARLIRESLINDEFDTEYFNGRGYATLMFEGESDNPERVAEEIKNEIKRIRQNGIDKKLFSAVKCAMYGDAIRRFDNVEGIAMQLVDCAVSGYNLFDEIKLLKTVTFEDVYRQLEYFDEDNTVLSVVFPCSNQGGN